MPERNLIFVGFYAGSISTEGNEVVVRIPFADQSGATDALPHIHAMFAEVA